jgi:hypothetical protein
MLDSLWELLFKCFLSNMRTLHVVSRGAKGLPRFRNSKLNRVTASTSVPSFGSTILVADNLKLLHAKFTGFATTVILIIRYLHMGNNK